MTESCGHGDLDDSTLRGLAVVLRDELKELRTTGGSDAEIIDLSGELVEIVNELLTRQRRDQED